MSRRFFDNQPNEICSHLSEKALEGTFVKPEKLPNHSNEGKGREKKKERGEELPDYFNSWTVTKKVTHDERRQHKADG